MQEEALSSLLKTLKRVAESYCEAPLRDGETRNSFSIIISYCSHIHRGKSMPATRYGAGNQHQCIESDITYGNMVMGKRASNRVLAETIETQ